MMAVKPVFVLNQTVRFGALRPEWSAHIHLIKNLQPPKGSGCPAGQCLSSRLTPEPCLGIAWHGARCPRPELPQGCAEEPCG